MRILHVTKKYPNALGGDAIVVQNLEKQQTKNGHEVFILTTNCDNIEDKENLTKFGLRDKSENLDKMTFRRIFSLIDLRIKISKILKEIRPDIVHCHSVDMGYVISRACKKNNLFLINHFHTGLISIKKTDKLRSKLERFFITHSEFDKMITVNPNDLDSKEYHNLYFVPNGIDESLFKLKFKHKKNNKNLNLLYVGRVEKEKGLTYLIDAVKEIREEYPPIKLEILGKGNDFDYYKNLVRELNLQNCVKFEGQKNQKELIKHYSSADIFILPSLDEGFPLVILEAWSFKLPVITTNVGAVPKICTNNKNALIIPTQDRIAIKNSILKLINNKNLLDKIANKGKKVVNLNYSWRKISFNLEKIYMDSIK